MVELGPMFTQTECFKKFWNNILKSSDSTLFQAIYLYQSQGCVLLTESYKGLLKSTVRAKGLFVEATQIEMWKSTCIFMGMCCNDFLPT